MSATPLRVRDGALIVRDGAIVNYELIEDWEGGPQSGWTFDGTGSQTTVSGFAPGSNDARQITGFVEGHLAGADAVDRGPQPGDIVDIYWRIDQSSSTGISRFDFSKNGLDDGQGQFYRIEWESGSTSNKTVSIEKYDSNSVVKVDTTSFAPADGTAYRTRLWWNDGDNNIDIQQFDANDNSESGVASITDDSSASGSGYTEPGTFFFVNANITKTFDDWIIQP